MKTSSGWTPGKGDYRRSTGQTNKSIQQKEKAVFKKKIIQFFVLFIFLIGVSLLGNYLLCNTHKIIENTHKITE